MATHKLTYFDFAGSRGEECRLALHLAGIAFVDERLSQADWAARRPTTPFYGLPVLTVEGKGELAQSNAILGYIGRTHGLLPSDPWEAARHEAVMNAVEELRGAMDPSIDAKDPAEKKRLREELVAGYLPAWGECMERQIRGPFVGGERISVADLKLFIVTKWLAKGVLDHVPADLFARHVKLSHLPVAVAQHPDVARWYARK